MSKGGKPQYSFPTLSHDDILQTLQEMDFPVTQEDLEAPKVRGVLVRGTVPPHECAAVHVAVVRARARAVCVGGGRVCSGAWMDGHGGGVTLATRHRARWDARAPSKWWRLRRPAAATREGFVRERTVGGCRAYGVCACVRV